MTTLEEMSKDLARRHHQSIEDAIRAALDAGAPPWDLSILTDDRTKDTFLMLGTRKLVRFTVEIITTE